MARDAEMTAGTACGERQVPGPRGSSSHSNFGILSPGGLCRDSDGMLILPPCLGKLLQQRLELSWNGVFVFLRTWC